MPVGWLHPISTRLEKGEIAFCLFFWLLFLCSLTCSLTCSFLTHSFFKKPFLSSLLYPCLNNTYHFKSSVKHTDFHIGIIKNNCLYSYWKVCWRCRVLFVLETFTYIFVKWEIYVEHFYFYLFVHQNNTFWSFSSKTKALCTNGLCLTINLGLQYKRKQVWKCKLDQVYICSRPSTTYLDLNLGKTVWHNDKMDYYYYYCNVAMYHNDNITVLYQICLFAHKLPQKQELRHWNWHWKIGPWRFLPISDITT